MTKIRTANGEVDVDPAEATAAYQAGTATFDGPVQLVRGHEAGEVDPADLSSALQQGWEVATPEQQRTAKLRGEESGIRGSVQGGVEALARGVSLGLSDKGLAAVGVDMERASARRKELGGGAAALETIGAIAPAFFTGGSSAGASTAARLATLTPAAASTRLGLAAARGVGGGKLRQMAVQGAVEGLLGGAGAEISEAALGDTDLSAERLFVGAGQGGVLVGLLGGGTGLAGEGLARVARGGERVSRRAVESVAGITGDASSPGLRAAMRSGGDIVERAQHAQLKAMGATQAAHDGLSHLSALHRTKDGAELVAAARSPSSFDGLVGERIGKVWRGADTNEAAGRLERAFADDIGPKTRAAVQSRHDMLSERLGKMGLRGASAQTRKLAADARKVLGRDADLLASKPHTWLTETADALDELATKHQGAEGTVDIAYHVREMRALASDGLMWGPRVQHVQQLQAARRLEEAAVDALPARVRKTIKDGKFDASAAKSLAKYSDETSAVLDAKSKVADALELAGEDVGALRKGIDDVKQALAYRGELEKAGSSWRALQAFESGGSAKQVRQAVQWGSTLVGGLMGGVGGAFGGRVVGELLQAGTRPASTLAAMARIRQTLDRVAGREAGVVAGAERLAASVAPAARKVKAAAVATGRASGRVGRAAVSKATREEARSRQAALDATRRAVVQLATRPGDLPDKMGDGLHDLREVAPKVAASLVARTGAAVAFLASKAPRVYQAPFSKEAVVDPAELERFGRYVDAVQDPIAAAEEIERGGMALESAEALRVVYPKIHGELQREVLMMVGRRAKAGEPISHRAAVQLGLLLGLPLADELRPGFAAQLTAVTAPAQPAPAPTQIRAAGGSSDPPASRTGAQRLEAGGGARE